MTPSSPALCLEGRIDSTNAPAFQQALTQAIREAPDAQIVLDAQKLTYISSAGLRVLLAASKTLKQPLKLCGVSPEVYDIFEMTGFTSLLDIERRMREISVEGCQVIGRGAFGTVYRIDEDTIVKVYETPDAVPMILNEQKRAKQAFLKGIPTAISYDIVRVGDHYGSVFELLKATTLNDAIRAEPDRIDDFIRQYVRIIRLVHGIEAEPGVLPDCRALFSGYVDAVRSVLPSDMAERLKALIEGMPEDRHIVHGDLHMKNVMVSGGEPMLIDLDTLSTGNPVFDFAGLYAAYICFEEDDPGNCIRFIGLSADQCEQIFQKSAACYLGVSQEALRPEMDKIMVAGCLRFLYLIIVLHNGSPKLLDIRVRHTVEKLNSLLKTVNSLVLPAAPAE